MKKKTISDKIKCMKKRMHLKKAGLLFILVSVIFVAVALLLLSLATGGGGENTEPVVLLVNAKIPVNYQKINAGGSLLVQTEIILIKQEYNNAVTDVHIKYLIRDSSSKIITTVSETKGVIDRISTVKELMLPSEIKPGVYTIEVQAEYKGRTGTEAASFEVMKIKSSSPSGLTDKELILLLAILLVLFTAFFIALYYEHQKIKRLEQEGYQRI